MPFSRDGGVPARDRPRRARGAAAAGAGLRRAFVRDAAGCPRPCRPTRSPLPARDEWPCSLARLGRSLRSNLWRSALRRPGGGHDARVRRLRIVLREHEADRRGDRRGAQPGVRGGRRRGPACRPRAAGRAGRDRRAHAHGWHQPLAHPRGARGVRRAAKAGSRPRRAGASARGSSTRRCRTVAGWRCSIPQCAALAACRWGRRRKGSRGASNGVATSCARRPRSST